MSSSTGTDRREGTATLPFGHYAERGVTITMKLLWSVMMTLMTLVMLALSYSAFRAVARVLECAIAIGR